MRHRAVASGNFSMSYVILREIIEILRDKSMDSSSVPFAALFHEYQMLGIHVMMFHAADFEDTKQRQEASSEVYLEAVSDTVNSAQVHCFMDNKFSGWSDFLTQEQAYSTIHQIGRLIDFIDRQYND